MQKYLRWTAILAVLMLAVAACQPAADGGATGEPEETQPADGGEDPQAVCDADEFGCVTYGPDEPIRLASANAISGEVAFLGNDINGGIQVAVEERGQVLGRDIEIVEEDAGCGEAEDGQTAAVAIAADDTILAVIGTTCSRTAIPARPVLAEAGIFLISASNTAVSLTDREHPAFVEEGTDWYARTAYSDFFQGDADARFVCDELGLETAATIHDGSQYAEELQDVFVRQFEERCGGETVFQGSVGIGDVDFRQILTEIAGSNDGAAPDLLFFPIFNPEGGLIIDQSQETPGLEDMVLFSADGLKDAGTLEDRGDIAEELGMYFSGPLPPSGERYDSFLERYFEITGEDVPLAPYHSQAYDATMIYFDAIEAVAIEEADGTIHIPRTAFRDAVRGTTDFDGISGSLTCDENGDCGDTSVEVAQVRDGEYVQVFSSDEPE